MIGIRTVPSPESHELYSKVIKGQLKLQDIKKPQGHIHYQAPTPRNSITKNINTIKSTPRRTTNTLSDINIKPGTAIPLHLQKPSPVIDADHPDRDTDFDQGTEGKSLSEKLDYYRRNYRLSFIARRLTNGMTDMARKAGYAPPKMSREQEKKKKAAELWKMERKRKLGSRK